MKKYQTLIYGIGVAMALILHACANNIQTSAENPKTETATNNYFNATFHWDNPEMDEEGAEIEFADDGSCYLQDDLMDDMITYEGSYTVSGDQIFLDFGEGLTKTCQINWKGRFLTLDGRTFTQGNSQ